MVVIDRVDVSDVSDVSVSSGQGDIKNIEHILVPLDLPFQVPGPNRGISIL